MFNSKLLNIPVFLLSWFLSCITLTAQTTLIVEGIPDNTPPNDEIYISGDFEGWTGGQDAYRLEQVGENYAITFTKSEETIHFKFTKGSWDSVELDNDSQELDNRNLTLSNENDTVRVAIAKWADYSSKISTASANVHLLAEAFDMSPLDKKRRVKHLH